MTLERVIIHSIQDAVLCNLSVRHGEVKKEIDARSSDAIAPRSTHQQPYLRWKKSLLMPPSPADRDADEAEQRAFRDFLANLRPEDLIERGGLGSGES
jgi:bifunctional DNase/RNase